MGLALKNKVIVYPICIVEPVLKDHPIGHKNIVCHDRWSLVTGSIILKCRTLIYRICVVCQDSGLSRQVSLYMYMMYRQLGMSL